VTADTAGQPISAIAVAVITVGGLGLRRFLDWVWGEPAAEVTQRRPRPNPRIVRAGIYQAHRVPDGPLVMWWLPQRTRR
jgi:hypothetical protein